jgi:ABC-2 type transport system ATP-binding protein
MHLTISNLSKTYPGGVRALRDVSLTIGTGMFGLLGPNGAGKSTLMRTIATLQEADTGTIFLDSLDVLTEKHEVRRRLGFLPQEFDFYPGVSAYDLLDHFAVLKGIVDAKHRREAVNGLLERTNLSEYGRRKLGSFSGGMKRRFGIAQALLGDPKLIIVDEPTAGLDPKERNHFHNLLGEIGEERVVILSTHIVDDVGDLCRDMAIIDRGKVLMHEEPRAAIERFSGRIWSKVIPKADLPELARVHDVISHHQQGGNLAVRVLADSRPDPTFEASPPGLEDVYFAAIRAHGRS